MTDTVFDFAVAGDSAFAALTALALARSGASVCLIGEVPSPIEIDHDLALAPGPSSRPETLELAMTGIADLRTLLAGPGEALLRRANITFAALGAEGRTAASHARHLLNGFGTVTTLLPETASHAGFTAEGIWTLSTRAFFAGLDTRLEAAGVVAAGRIADVQINRDRVRFGLAHGFAEAAMLIITDATSIAAPDALPEEVTLATRTAILTDPVAGAAGRIALDIETGGHVCGRGDGRIEALVSSGDIDDIAKWLGPFLPAGTSARVIARNRHTALLSRDGAPLIARLPRRAATLATGFGAMGAFFAPALARHLTGVASAEESAWFEARGSGTARGPVADFGIIGGGSA